MSLDKVTLNFNENGKGSHIRIIVDILKGRVEIIDMYEPFISITLTSQQLHDISKLLLSKGL